MSDRRRLVESILVVVAVVLASVSLFKAYKKPPVIVIAEPDGGRKYGNAYPYVDLSGAQTVLANPPLKHGNGGTDVTSPGANGNLLTSNGTNWTSAASTSASCPINASTCLTGITAPANGGLGTGSVCPNNTVPVSNGTNYGSCSPLSPGCTLNSMITQTSGALGCGPAPGASGNVAVSNGSTWTSGTLSLSSIPAGSTNTLLATDNSSVVGWKGITPGGDITLSTPITGSSIPFEVIGWATIPLSGTLPTNQQAYLYNTTGNIWRPTSIQSQPVLSGADHPSAASVPLSYATFGSVSLTVPSGLTATIDCTAAIEWSVTVSGASHTLSWGISQDSLAAPTHVRTLVSPTSIVGGAMVESYSGTSAGAHTYRILGQDPTATGVSIIQGDLLCSQH